jgi:membrane associated rhomboid family serine protease
VWTLATTFLVEPDFLTLLLSGLMLWMFVPTLERFWGTRRLYRFVAVTSIVGALAGCAMGLLTGREFPITGASSFIYASIVAFGVVYATHPVQFFGVLPMTGRQMMYGFLGFLLLYITLQAFWELGAATAAAMVAAAAMTSKRWSPGLAWRRWRIARARARLSVIEGGGGKRSPKRSDEQQFLN